MAPDAVIRLIERSHQVRAAVGQRETLAPAQILGRQGVARKSLRGVGLNRHQAHEIELPRRFEQHSGAVFRLALLGHGRPGRVTGRQFERVGVGRLVLLPPRDVPSKGQLAEGLAETGRELALGGRTVQVLRVGELDLVQRAALHEQALD